MEEAQEENDAEPFIALDWHKAAAYLTKHKKFLDDLDIEPFPGCGKVGYDYLRLLTLRLAEDTEIQEKAMPRPHHLVLDLEVNRGGIIDRSTIVTASPLDENAYRVSIAQTKSKYKSTVLGVFDMDGAVRVIKQAVQEIWQNP